MAGGPGFEPGPRGSEPRVLPLNYPPIRKTAIIRTNSWLVAYAARACVAVGVALGWAAYNSTNWRATKFGLRYRIGGKDRGRLPGADVGHVWSLTSGKGNASEIRAAV